MMTVSAVIRFKPRPPARVDRRNTNLGMVIDNLWEGRRKESMRREGGRVKDKRREKVEKN